MNPQKRSSGCQFYIVQGSPQGESMLTRIEDQKGFKYTDEQKRFMPRSVAHLFLIRITQSLVKS
ncbi:MAG: hypothetical protein U0T81_18725 [Saprospiraceae bacterium]